MSSKLVIVTAIAVVSLSLQSPVALGQTKKKSQGRTSVGIFPAAESAAIIKKADQHTPIRFKPFPMVDENGRPVSPTLQIKLPNGKSTTAKDYFDSLNHIEKGLNEVGYSMRSLDGKTTLGSPFVTHPKIERTTAAYEKNILKDTVKGSPVPGPIFEVTNTGATGQRNSHTLSSLRLAARRGALINPLGITQALTKIPAGSSKTSVGPGGSRQKTGSQGKTSVDPGGLRDRYGMDSPVKFSKPWSFKTGDSDFGAYFDGSLDIEGEAVTANGSGKFSDSQSVFKASLSGKAGVTLMSNNFDLVNYQAEFDGSDVTKKVHFGAGFYVAGVQVYSEDISKDIGYTFEDGWSIPYKQETPTFVFPVFGPFVIKGKAGAMGEAGVKLSVILFSSHIQGEVNPYAKSKAYAQIAGSLDLDIASAEAGVKCDMTLLNDDLRIGTNVGIAFDSAKKQMNLQEEFYCTNDIDCLSGQLTLYATVYGLFGVKLHEWDWDWYNWQGYKANTVFFNKQYDQPLLWN
jgi:hypothetical protein